MLGQYELALLDPERPPRLLFVAPNLAEAARALDADEDELLRWVAFHEVTHAVQFTGVPWLRAHLAGAAQRAARVAGAQGRPGGAAAPAHAATTCAGVGRGARGRPGRAVAGPERKAIIDRLQATMALIEGHAEHVMDAVGAAVLPSLPKLREALDRRRARASPPLVKLLERLIGLDMKLRQYEIGKRFCDAVVARRAASRASTAPGRPELLPTLAELEDPAAWVRRTRVRAVTSGSVGVYKHVFAGTFVVRLELIP